MVQWKLGPSKLEVSEKISATKNKPSKQRKIFQRLLVCTNDISHLNESILIKTERRGQYRGLYREISPLFCLWLRHCWQILLKACYADSNIIYTLFKHIVVFKQQHHLYDSFSWVIEAGSSSSRQKKKFQK